jgi:hypothetical protein
LVSNITMLYETFNSLKEALGQDYFSLPFYNKTLEKQFEEVLNEKILGIKSKQKVKK